MDTLFTALYCIKSPEKLEFKGDYNGDIASMISLEFDECDT